MDMHITVAKILLRNDASVHLKDRDGESILTGDIYNSYFNTKFELGIQTNFTIEDEAKAHEHG